MKARNPYSVIVDGYLEDYEGGVGVLGKAPSEAIHDQAAEVLCELSRDIMFSLGAVADYDPAYIRRIADLFETAAANIKPRNSSDLAAFKAHIESRATRLRAEVGGGQAAATTAAK